MVAGFWLLVTRHFVTRHALRLCSALPIPPFNFPPLNLSRARREGGNAEGKGGSYFQAAQSLKFRTIITLTSEIWLLTSRYMLLVTCYSSLVTHYASRFFHPCPEGQKKREVLLFPSNKLLGYYRLIPPEFF